MKFITLSEKEIKTPAVYNSIKEPHIVISISGVNDHETLIPNNVTRKGELHLKFDDVEDITDEYIYFDRGCARGDIRLCRKILHTDILSRSTM